AAFVWPAERPPDFILGLRFGLVVRKIRPSRWMHPYRNIAARRFVEQRLKLGQVQGLSGGVGIDLNSKRSQLIDSAVHFLQVLFGIVNRQTRDKAGKSFRVFRD